jgi:hypothetical protein
MHVAMGVLLHADEVSRHYLLYLHRSKPPQRLIPAACVDVSKCAAGGLA